MASEIFRPMTPNSFKFVKTLNGTDPDYANKFQPIWTPYTPLTVDPQGFTGDFTNYQLTEFTSGNDSPPRAQLRDIVIYQAVPLGDFSDWVGKGPFSNIYISGGMGFQFFTEYRGDLDPPGYAVHVDILTIECGNNHRPWIGQTVTMRALVKTETWVDNEITNTTYRDVEYIHECVSGDFATSPVKDYPDTPYGYTSGGTNAPGEFTQLIEDVDFLEQSVVDGSGTYENFDPQDISIATYPLEYSRTSYFTEE